MEQVSFSASQLAEIDLILLQNGIDLNNIQGDIQQLVIEAIQSREDQHLANQGTNFHFQTHCAFKVIYRPISHKVSGR